VRGFRLTPFVPGVAAAWLVTLVMASVGATAVAFARNPSSASEMALLFPLLMSVPFALTTAFVLLPVAAIVAAKAGRRWWLVGVAVVAAAPLQVLAILAAGRVLFRGSHMRPTLSDDVAAVLGHPSPTTLAILLAFAAGGVTLAFWFRTPARSI
jgi:hypothetical protein